MREHWGDKHLYAVAGFLAGCLLAAIGFASQTEALWSQEAAGWFQAISSVGAIGIASWIPTRIHRETIRREEIRLNNRIRALAPLAISALMKIQGEASAHCAIGESCNEQGVAFSTQQNFATALYINTPAELSAVTAESHLFSSETAIDIALCASLVAGYNTQMRQNIETANLLGIEPINIDDAMLSTLRSIVEHAEDALQGIRENFSGTLKFMARDAGWTEARIADLYTEIEAGK